MLDPKTKERIAQDVKNAYANTKKPEDCHDEFYVGYDVGYFEGYIAGGEAEAERAQPVIEALEYLINDVRRKPNDTRYTTALNKATEALGNYNSTTVK